MAHWAKNLPATQEIQETMGLIPRLGWSPGEGNGNILQYFLPEKSHVQKSLAGYSPKGRNESGRTEQIKHSHTHTHTHSHLIYYLQQPQDTDKN